MGGYVSLAFWRKYRERVRSLILCDTRSAADTPEAAAARKVLADKATAEGMEQLAEAMLPKLIHPRTPADRPQVAAAVRRMILETNPGGAAAALRGMALRPDCADLLQTINVRTLVFVGEQDTISPPDEMHKIAAAIPGAKFVVIPDAGHMSPMENPERVKAELLTFLANELLMR
jgi:pimeloyl-ACP methyl ester carboxylesterase